MNLLTSGNEGIIMEERRGWLPTECKSKLGTIGAFHLGMPLSVPALISVVLEGLGNGA